jgi:hypothetical protein
MTENVRKLVGVVAMAALVVVGVVTTSGGDDDDFTRNLIVTPSVIAFAKLPEVEQARVGNSFVQRAAPKAIDTGRTQDDAIYKTNKASDQIKAGIVLQSGGTHAYAQKLWTGKASVLEGRGVDGKGGTSSYRAGTGMDGKTGKAGIWSGTGVSALSGRKAGIWLQSGGVDGYAQKVADRIGQCVGSGFPSVIDNTRATVDFNEVVKNVLVSSYMENTKDIASGYNCQDLQGKDLLPDDTSFPAVVNPDSMKPLLLAACMESRVGDVFLNSHIKAMAAECVAIVLPALSPERAKRLGTYWQTPEQLLASPFEK